MTDTGMTELLMPLENISLEEQLANIGVSFHDKLFELIYEAHLDNKDVWKRANLDRKHFGSIIFFVGLTLPRYRFSKPSASLDMNLR